MSAEASSAFISYSRVDSAFASRLARDLKNAGADVWLDRLDIAPGELWDMAVERALNRCPRVLVILSPTSVQSQGVLDEVGFALKRNKKIIPIFYLDCEIPFRLDRFQYVDFRSDYDSALEELLRVLPHEALQERVPIAAGMPAQSHDASYGAERVRSPQGKAATSSGRTETSTAYFRRIPTWVKVTLCGALLLSLIVFGILHGGSLRQQTGTSPTGNVPLSGDSSSGPVQPTKTGMESSAIPTDQSAKAPAQPEKASVLPTAGTNNPKAAKIAEKDQGATVDAAALDAKSFQLIEDKKYGEAFPLTKKACDLGNDASCVRLGYLYGTGSGVDLDLPLAVSLYRKGCDSGNLYGCLNLAVMYENGRGVPENKTQAATLYRKACDGGNTEGCRGLGFMYEHGAGVSEDYQQSVSLYRKSCDNGNVQGCQNLGYMYDRGTGVAQDFSQAVTLYRRSCNGGLAEGCTSLGTMYDKATGVGEDHQQAVALYRKGCDGGNMVGCYDLAIRYESGVGVTQDKTQATALYRKACDGGYKDSCEYLKNRSQ